MPLLRDISALCNLTSLVAWRAGDAAAADTLSMLTALQHLELHGSSDCQQHNFVPILRLGLLTNLSLPESGWQRQQNEPPTPAQDFVCDTLSQLTSLVKLNTTAFALTDGQLQQLTALTGLSSLVIKLDGFSEQLKARLQDLGNYQTFQCFLTSKVRLRHTCLILRHRPWVFKLGYSQVVVFCTSLTVSCCMNPTASSSH